MIATSNLTTKNNRQSAQFAQSSITHNVLGNDSDSIDSTRYLTKYEETKIIGLRAQQIASGSMQLVECTSLDPLVIARQELKEHKIPFVLYRPYPDGSKKKVILNK